MRDGDRLRGGPGNDKLVPGRDRNSAADGAYDSILYDTSPRRVVVNLARGRATGDGTDRIVFNGTISVTTTRFADRVIGSRFKDVVLAQEGADYVSAGRGNDIIATDKRSNPLSRDAGDVAIGGPGDDFIFSIGHNDVVKGGVGNDEFSRFPQGGGLIDGGPGSDNIALATDVDGLAANVPARTERVVGGSGVDQIFISAPTDTTLPATFTMATGAFHLGTPVPMNFALSGVERNIYGGGTVAGDRVQRQRLHRGDPRDLRDHDRARRQRHAPWQPWCQHLRRRGRHRGLLPTPGRPRRERHPHRGRGGAQHLPWLPLAEDAELLFGAPARARWLTWSKPAIRTGLFPSPATEEHA